MTPLNATEWLEALRVGADPRAVDYAGELLDKVAYLAEDDRTETFREITADLEKAAGKSFDESWRMVEFFTDRHHLLTELEEQLENAGFEGDPADALERLLDRLTDLQETDI